MTDPERSGLSGQNCEQHGRITEEIFYAASAEKAGV